MPATPLPLSPSLPASEFTTTTLWNNQGTSDKIYQPVLEPWEGHWRLYGLYGRRGCQLNIDIKGTGMSWLSGLASYRALVAEKIRKKYVESKGIVPDAQPMPPETTAGAASTAKQVIIQAAPIVPAHIAPAMVVSVSNATIAGASVTATTPAQHCKQPQGHPLPLLLQVFPVKRVVTRKEHAAIIRRSGGNHAIALGAGYACYVGWEAAEVAVWNMEGKPMAMRSATRQWLQVVLPFLVSNSVVLLGFLDEKNHLFDVVSPYARTLDGNIRRTVDAQGKPGHDLAVAEHAQPAVAQTDVYTIMLSGMAALMSSGISTAHGCAVRLAKKSVDLTERKNALKYFVEEVSRKMGFLVLEDGEPVVEIKATSPSLGWMTAPVNGMSALVVLDENSNHVVLMDQVPSSKPPGSPGHAVRFSCMYPADRSPYCEKITVLEPILWARRADCTMSRFLALFGEK